MTKIPVTQNILDSILSDRDEWSKRALAAETKVERLRSERNANRCLICETPADHDQRLCVRQVERLRAALDDRDHDYQRAAALADKLGIENERLRAALTEHHDYTARPNRTCWCGQALEGTSE
jgi:hypothetical protein